MHVVKQHELVLCDHIVFELREVVARKKPELAADLDSLLMQLSYELIAAPQEPSKFINDPQDYPILNAAILADVDIIISGDKHFLELNLARPQTMSAAEFWRSENNF
ncbi:putative PIN domain protein [Candidatus Termititenax aidoneus]|uniref:PIN domain protein n=1 Tax=Termititenax aidoneus TaxID=2218524 RepID=A0A388T7D1_TERA1|nr:putative PIN domain protein [Candidatus Termititenax aidoneus]